MHFGFVQSVITIPLEYLIEMLGMVAHIALVVKRFPEKMILKHSIQKLQKNGIIP